MTGNQGTGNAKVVATQHSPSDVPAERRGQRELCFDNWVWTVRGYKAGTREVLSSDELSPKEAHDLMIEWGGDPNTCAELEFHWRHPKPFEYESAHDHNHRGVFRAEDWGLLYKREFGDVEETVYTEEWLFTSMGKWLLLDESYHAGADVAFAPKISVLQPDEVMDWCIKHGFDVPEELLPLLSERSLRPDNLESVQAMVGESQLENHEDSGDPTSAPELTSRPRGLYVGDDNHTSGADRDLMRWREEMQGISLDDLVPAYPLEKEKRSYPGDNLQRDRFVYWKRRFRKKRGWKVKQIDEAANRRWKNIVDRRTLRRQSDKYAEWLGLRIIRS